MNITEACIKVRNKILREMRKEGFQYHWKIRHDAIPYNIPEMEE
jgi:hypothetical protein